MKIFFLSHGCTYSADTGGKIRTYELNRAISDNHFVFQLSINPFFINKTLKISPFRVNINKNYEEVVFNSFLLTAYAFLSKIFNFSQEIYLNKFIKLHNFPYVQQLNESDLLITSSPWLTEWMISHTTNKKPFIYAPADILLDFYKPIQRNNTKLFERIKSIEKMTLMMAAHIITVSEEDRKRLIELYEIDVKKISVIPNGVNTEKFKNINKLRNKYQALFDIKNRKVILFVGGKHHPSIKAAEFIEYIAQKFSDALFYIVGGVGKSSGSHENIIYTGRVSDVQPYFAIADLAINPIQTGTGSNIKLLEYLAAGVPCVSTKYGIRATQLKNRKEVLLAENESQFINQINILLNNYSLRKSISENGKKVIEKYDWKILALKLEKILRRFL